MTAPIIVGAGLVLFAFPARLGAQGPMPSPAPLASAAPGSPAPVSPAPSETAPASLPREPEAPLGTPPPIIVDPPSAGVTPGGSMTLRVSSVLGAIEATSANPQIADVAVDQVTRMLTIYGKALGATTVTVRDSRGLTRDVAVRVAYNAGAVADAASIRITGDPATVAFVKEQAIAAASRAARLRPGASIVATPESVSVRGNLRIDNVTVVDVPVIIQGEGYFTVSGTTHVRVENFAQPRIRPRSLLVSDFPETLRENGILFSADLTLREPARFLYYHYNPPGQPDRRILLRAQNPSSQPAVVQFISGAAGPGPNEMEVGHLSTQRFLVREAQNEGTVIVVPAGATINLVDHPLPARSVVSNLLQLRELEGAPLHLVLSAANASDPVDGPLSEGALLNGDVRHARGVYPIPEFHFDYTYVVEGPYVEMPIGQIPLPNLRQGEALAGDYGVLQSLTLKIVNLNPFPARVAIYMNPRGGGATGTFLIDGVLVQAHRVPAFAKVKLREFVVPKLGFISVSIVTMPEGGSSYPVRLIAAPDDGSVSPGAPGSPVY